MIYGIIRSAVDLHTLTGDGLPLEIFVFGESIPFGGVMEKFLWRPMQIY